MAGARLQHDRATFDRPGHRATMIERKRIRYHTGATYQPIGRHESDESAVGGRPADRAAGVSAHGERGETRGPRRAGTARRAAREMLQVPRIARRGPRQVERGAAVSELVRRELAEEHGARLIKLARRARILAGNVVRADLRMSGRAASPGV